MKRNFLKPIALVAIAGIAFVSSCKKEEAVTPVTTTSTQYSSVKDFLSQNAAPIQVYTINGATGGTFTTSQGTKVTVPANAFVTSTGGGVTGNVKIEFKDIYKKSEMLFSDVPTQTSWGAMLKSGGEFFLKATVNNKGLDLANGKKIVVEQPAAGQVDQGMLPFENAADSIPGQGGGWWQTPEDSIAYTVSSYVFSLYNFSNPLDSGTWCNSDNPNYFNTYQNTSLKLHPIDDPAAYHTDVFLVFSSVNSMIHVYKDYTPGSNDYTYSFAPVGLQCTLVAIGVKDGKVYSAFKPVTISANQTVNFTLSETTADAFKSQLNALN